MTITQEKSRTLVYAFIGLTLAVIAFLLVFPDIKGSLHISFLLIAIVLTGILFYTSSSFGLSYQVASKSQQDLDKKNIRLALSFQGQGKLDAAYALFKQCNDSKKITPYLTYLAQDYEIIKQTKKANEVYKYIKSFDTGQSTENSSKVVKKEVPKVAGISDKDLFNQRYEIIRNIGKGTGSNIFLAKDYQHNKQHVALKIIKINYDEKNALEIELLASFMLEAETAASLQNKNIISITDSGHADNIAYIAMEYIQGKPLQNYSRPKSLLPSSLVIELIAQCADALHYAHEKGIIHRDVKPANILYDHAARLAKLSDFGIAHIANSTQTLAGSFLGTPFYMSPEQLASQKLDARSDIFSLGATLYRLLTGVLPFSGNSMSKLIQTIVNEPQQNIQELNPNLPNNLANAVEIALAKEPEQRFSSALEFSRQLRACTTT